MRPPFRRILALSATAMVSSVLVLSSAGVAMADPESPPSDPHAAVIDTAPVEASTLGPDAQYQQVAFTLSPQSHSMQLATVPGTTTAELQLLDVFTGALTSSFSVGEHFDEIKQVSTYNEFPADNALRVLIVGTQNNATKIVRVKSTAPSAFTDASVEVLSNDSVVRHDTLELLAPMGVGLIVVHRDSSDTLVAQRIDYNLDAISGRNPVALPFTGTFDLTYDPSYGNILAVGTDGIQSVSAYAPTSLKSFDVASLGELVSITINGSYAIATGIQGELAVLDINSGTVSNRWKLPAAAGTAVYNSTLNEVLAVSATGDTVWRYASDGTERTAVSVPGLKIQPGSFSSTTSYNFTHSFTAVAGSNSYRYTMNYQARFEPLYVGKLAAGARGDGLIFSFSSKGSGLKPTNAWEYSLDGGDSWAQRGAAWSTATSDTGTVNTILPELPAPLDDTAPYFRQDVAEDGIIAPFAFSTSEYDVKLPDSGYDALWRLRINSPLGSVVTEPAPVTIGDGSEDTSLRFTRHPTPTTVSFGQKASFAVTVAGASSSIDRWQISDDGETWKDIDETATTLEYAAELADNESLVRAVATNGTSEVFSEPAKLTVLSATMPSIGAAPEGATIINGAAMNFSLNAYSEEWPRDAYGPGVVAGSEHGFDFTGGQGWTSADGEAHVLWDGTAIYRPYGGMNGLNLTFANPYLAIDQHGRGTLTADVFWNNGGGMGAAGASKDSGGFKRVVIATVIDAEIVSDESGLSISGTPEWDYRPYVGPELSETNQYASSFPASFLDYLDVGLRPWFLSTGSRNDDKPMSQIVVSGQQSNESASTTGETVSAIDPLGDGVYHFADVAPTISEQPVEVTRVDTGGTVRLTAVATGHPEPTVQWQRLAEGTWVDIEAATTNTLEIVDVKEGEYDLRAVFTNRRAAVISDTAQLIVTTPVIPVDPDDEKDEDENKDEDKDKDKNQKDETKDDARNDSATTTVSGEVLAKTGAETSLPLVGWAAGLLLLTGGFMLVIRRFTTRRVTEAKE